ncbi:MAG: hypothetical protein H5U40_08430 [Polyangiaceae bacterium]|nr:hypothetical protein [Polyangiaceae bacterium]
MMGGLPSPSCASVAWSELGSWRVGVLASEVTAVLDSPPLDGTAAIDLAVALGAPLPDAGLSRKWVHVIAGNCWLGLGASLRITPESSDPVHPLPTFVDGLARAIGIAAVVPTNGGFGYVFDALGVARLAASSAIERVKEGSE